MLGLLIAKTVWLCQRSSYTEGPTPPGSSGTALRRKTSPDIQPAPATAFFHCLASASRVRSKGSEAMVGFFWGPSRRSEGSDHLEAPIQALSPAWERKKQGTNEQKEREKEGRRRKRDRDR